mgnify:CR=1 FL=1
MEWNIPKRERAELAPKSTTVGESLPNGAKYAPAADRGQVDRGPAP